MDFDASVMASIGAVIGGLGLAMYGFTRKANNSLDRWYRGYLCGGGFFAFLAGTACLVVAAGQYVASSWVAIAIVAGANLVLQPMALLLSWMGARKIGLGLGGRVAYPAWWRAPEEELAKLSPHERRMLARYCVFQGLLALPLGVAMSIGCAWPLVQW